MNADLKFSANNEGERDDDKKARVENISFTGNSLAKTKAVSFRNLFLLQKRAITIHPIQLLLALY